MKSLSEIEQQIAVLKDKIVCQENGNDSYYISPLYHQQLLQLEGLQAERDVLIGKVAPLTIDFDNLPEKKKDLLEKMAQEYGIWFASCYKDLSDDELILNFFNDTKDDLFDAFYRQYFGDFQNSSTSSSDKN